MSSLIRRIQLAVKRKNSLFTRGRQLGVHNPKAKDLLARQKREQARKSKEGN